MCHEIGDGHTAAQKKSDRPRVSADEQREAAEEFQRRLKPQKRRHIWSGRREAEEFLQSVLHEQQRRDNAQCAESIGRPFLQ